MAQAAIKQTELDEAFEQWCKQQDEATTDKLTEIYNTAFNSIVERQIDVSTFDYFPNAAHTEETPMNIKNRGYAWVARPDLTCA